MPVTQRLPHRLGIILPSLDRNAAPLGPRTRRALRRRAERWFARAFPGSTADRLQVRPRLRGRWRSGSTVTVEHVEELWAYCTAAELKALHPSLVRLAEALCLEADQDAIAILVDAGMEIVTGGTE